MNYHSLILRFLKEKKIYYILKTFHLEDVFRLKSLDGSLYDVLDSSLAWNRMSEGFNFWYEKQLDLIHTICLFYIRKGLNNEKDINYNRIVDYYYNLVSGYESNGSHETDFWKQHRIKYNHIARTVTRDGVCTKYLF